MPDKRMFYQDAIYPGQDVSADNKLKNVKICIDTSGSISQLDLQRILGQVLDLLKQFKVTAELICWDAEAYSMGQLTSEIQIPNADLVGGGGTDPNCVFKYFESKDCKIKPFVTLIFTDAYFSMDNFKDSYKKKYKNTIWIMTEDHDDDFKPPFGKVAFAKFYDE
jgi:predicted metal-dependent peptidase